MGMRAAAEVVPCFRGLSGHLPGARQVFIYLICTFGFLNSAKAQLAGDLAQRNVHWLKYTVHISFAAGSGQLGLCDIGILKCALAPSGDTRGPRDPASRGVPARKTPPSLGAQHTWSQRWESNP